MFSLKKKINNYLLVLLFNSIIKWTFDEWYENYNEFICIDIGTQITRLNGYAVPKSLKI